MGPKKKNAPNAYWMFVMEMKAQNHWTRDEAEEIAQKKWKEMTKEEKQPYELKARIEKNHLKHDLSQKFTSQGVSFKQLDRQREERLKKEEDMRRDIALVHNLDPNGSLKTERFFLIHVNYFCKDDKDIYIPCEIGICIFNFKDGVRNTYHKIINPGEIPLGYRYEADLSSKERHMIPVDGSIGDNNYFLIYKDIMNFITDENDDRIPPLYTYDHMDDNIKVVQSFFKILMESVPDECDGIPRIYPLANLFSELKRASSRSTPGGEPFKTDSVAEMHLERDTFNYSKDISCDFHEQNDCVVHCSLSIVKRWAYCICDHCCQDMGIEIKPGYHVPKWTNVNQNFSTAPSSVNSERSSTAPSRASNSVASSRNEFSYVQAARVPKEEEEEEDLKPLRRPKTSAIAKQVVRGTAWNMSSSSSEAVVGASSSEFPALGDVRRRNNPPPIAVRGRGVAANFQRLRLDD